MSIFKIRSFLGLAGYYRRFENGLKLSIRGRIVGLLSLPESRSDPIGGSEPSSGCETVYWDSLPEFFFFKDEMVPVGMAHIL